jgi:pyruvate-formate lyase
MQQQQQQLEEEQRRQEVQGIAENYYSKVSKGAELFEDFDSVMADFDPSAFPEIVQLVAGMDNVPQVMYELSSNPQKLATISRLAERSSKMAQAQLNRLSQSIAKNEQAQASEGSVQPPLSHEKSSVRAGVDNGVNTVGDYKKMSFLKG